MWPIILFCMIAQSMLRLTAISLEKILTLRSLSYHYIKSEDEDQLTDLFIKRLLCGVFEGSINKLNMFDIYAKFEGKC